MYIIRHGISVGNVNEWFYGHTDLPLTEEGKKELATQRESGMYPSHEDALCFTSGMRRTEETFTAIFGDVEHGKIPHLMEINFGDYECKKYDELIDEEHFLKWNEDESGRTQFPNGESRNDFDKRVRNGLNTLIDQFKGTEKVIAVIHGGVISKIFEFLFPEEKKTEWDFLPLPGYGYVIEFENNMPVNYREIRKV